jgi:hypothetical protein
MPQAGFCAQCNANVWVSEDGSCPNGHPASSISGTFEAMPAVPAPAQAQSSPTPWIIAGVLALVLLVVFINQSQTNQTTSTFAGAAATFSAASANAQLKSCQANQRTIDGAVQVYRADTNQDAPSDYAAAMSVLVPEYLKVEPRCPGGGTYSFNSEGSAQCSVHPHY